MAVIEFDGVSKAYRLGMSRTSLREALPRVGRRLFGRKSTGHGGQIFWALKDVSFSVEAGEVLGIIGHNGAGKSTILKLLSKVTYPTLGTIRTQGRMAALIELGAGFHPELSGRENVYLNGTILGLKRREIDAQFSNMVEFAGLEQFIDTPVKRYSSGMYVRLAFAVAAHVKADLILVDEVLSVGDASFQQKCLAKMQELRDQGATIIFVSHNLWSVRSFCRRVLLLRAGQVVAEGDAPGVIEQYRRAERERTLVSLKHSGDSARPQFSDRAHGDDKTIITQVDLLDLEGQPGEVFASSDSLIVCAHYVAPQPIEHPAFGIQIRRADGLLCCQFFNMTENVPPIHGPGQFAARIGPLQLVPDIYSVEVRVFDRQQPIVYAEGAGGAFHVRGYMGDFEHTGVFRPPAEWLDT